MTSRGAQADLADNLGFAIPINYVKDFLRHREAFSFDKANPNSGYRYLDPPAPAASRAARGADPGPGRIARPPARPGRAAAAARARP